jgi:cytosine/adenosine deaminase-related metal-dependent hydrolase
VVTGLPRVAAILDRIAADIDELARTRAASSRLISGMVNGIMPRRAAADRAGPGTASATSVAARACGMGDRKGRLRVGYDADLVVVEGDPHADIRALSAVQAVYLNGQAVTQLAA